MVTSFMPIMRWLSPPVLSTAGTTRRARAFWTVAWSFFALLTALLGAAILATPETAARRGTSIMIVGILVLGLHVLNRRGRTAAASWILVVGLTAIVTQRAWFTGGVHAPVSLFYMLFVLIAAVLLGARASIVTAVACVGSAAVLTAGELQGWLVPPSGAGSTAVAFIAVLLALSVTLVCMKLLLGQVKDLTTDDLVNMFVHDMRSPLTVIMARLAMLRDEIRDNSESVEHAEAAMADAVRLNRMANNLLDISRLEAARLPLHRTPTDVVPIVRRVIQALGALDLTRHIEMRARAPVVCECDAELLRRVMENLVSNALKHTPSGGHIIVHVASTPACVRLAVQDEGGGVPPEARERIFDRFSASGLRASSGHHSVGLGLAFCKLAVEAHGGKIWVEDATPRGSVFVVELPPE